MNFQAFTPRTDSFREGALNPGTPPKYAQACECYIVTRV